MGVVYYHRINGAGSFVFFHELLTSLGHICLRELTKGLTLRVAYNLFFQMADGLKWEV